MEKHMVEGTVFHIHNFYFFLFCFSKLTFQKKSFRNTIIVSVLESDQGPHSVEPDLGPKCPSLIWVKKCLQKL